MFHLRYLQDLEWEDGTCKCRGSVGERHVPATQAAKSPADHLTAPPNPPPAITPAFLPPRCVQIRP